MSKCDTLFFSILFLNIELIFSQCANPANIYHFTYNGKNYEIVKEQKTWANAAACAVERGGYLAEINDANEQAAIWDAIVNGASIPENYCIVTTGGGIAYLWIGATDQNNEGQWIWDGDNSGSGTLFWTGQGAAGAGNGTAVNGLYNNWGGSSTGTRQEPDNFQGLQHYAAIGLSGWPSGTTMFGSASEWNDLKGDIPLYFVIEKDGQTGMLENEVPYIKIFPNPAKETVCIETNAIISKVEIIDIIGNRKAFVQNNYNSINIKHLASGVYFIKIAFDNQNIIIRKFIKN